MSDQDKLARLRDEAMRATEQARISLREHARALTGTDRGLAKLQAVWTPDRLPKLLGLIEKLPLLPVEAAAHVESARGLAIEWLREEKDGRSTRFQADLKAACATRGLTVALVTKDPLELRIPPFAVVLDLQKDRAEILFGRVTVGRSRSEPEALLTAHEKALKSLSEGLDPERLFSELCQAYERVAKVPAGSGGPWVDLQDVLFELAIKRQPAKFRSDPVAANFRAYGKARFLFDLHRLREANALTRGGLRLVLGPAAGASTRDKQRVFFVEDASGNGAYHMTMRFTAESEVKLG